MATKAKATKKPAAKKPAKAKAKAKTSKKQFLKSRYQGLSPAEMRGFFFIMRCKMKATVLIEKNEASYC